MNKQTRGRTLDHAAEVYDFGQQFVTLGQETRLNRHVIEALAPTPGDRILDVGCGTGALTALIGEKLDANSGGQAVGIDAAPRMIEVAQRKRGGPAVRFQTAIAEDLPFESDSFDRACSSFFFHHVDYELKVKALQEMRRVLRPGGRLVVLDIDVPTTWYGHVFIRSGEWLFRQPEIAENRRGLLRRAFDAASLAGWRQVGHWQGYITLFCRDSHPYPRQSGS